MDSASQPSVSVVSELPVAEGSFNTFFDTRTFKGAENAFAAADGAPGRRRMRRDVHYPSATGDGPAT